MKTQQYNRLITDVKEAVYRIAIAILDNGAEAEDILQDVRERVWRTRDTVLDSQYPRAYVCRIARNLAIDRLRHRRFTACLADTLYKNIGDDGNAATDINDISSLTRRLIASLPEKQRITMELRDVEGYEIEEIAALVESDETSVRMNLSRARKTIRKQLIKAMNYGVGRD